MRHGAGDDGMSSHGSVGSGNGDGSCGGLRRLNRRCRSNKAQISKTKATTTNETTTTTMAIHLASLQSLNVTGITPLLVDIQLRVSVVVTDELGRSLVTASVFTEVDLVTVVFEVKFD